MLTFIKEIGCGMLYHTGLSRLPRFNTRILTYHKANPKYFEAQIAYLAKNYKTVALRDIFTEQGFVSTARQLHGKELSYNNILDVDAAFELVKEFEKPSAAVIKHTNPSGVASAEKIEDAYIKAHEADPKSAFGCIVALNRNFNL